jgi:hypothetical protein
VRIHGIHFRGIHAPQGEHRIAFDPGYNVVVAPDAVDTLALVRLIELLLYPREDLGTLAEFAADAEARAELSFSLGDTYRVILDFARGRFVLARQTPGSDGYERVSTDPVQICLVLREAGLPAPEDFAILHLLAAPGRAPKPQPESEPQHVSKPATPATPITPAITPASTAGATPSVPTLPSLHPPPEPMAAPVLDAAREEARLQDRRRILRRARERLLVLEREEKLVAGELERCAPLADAVPELDAQLERYQDATSARVEERAALEATRRSLIEERVRLGAAPARQRPVMWLGVTLAGAAAAAGAMVAPALYLIALAGIGTAVSGLLATRRSRRQTGQAEARLAALRLRESSLERRFEAETAPLQVLLESLGLSSVDELQREAADFRGLIGRVDAVRRDLDEARGAFPPEADEELGEIESRLARASAADAPTPLVEMMPTPPTEPLREPKEAPLVESSDDDTWTDPNPPTGFLGDVSGRRSAVSVEALLRAGELVSGTPEREIRERLSAALPIYLRALTDGEYTRAWYHGDDWYLRCESRSDRVPLRDATADVRGRLLLAFRLALLETLAPSTKLPLLIGPALRELALPADALETVARAFRRLGGARQVIQCCTDGTTFADAAAAVYELSA